MPSGKDLKSKHAISGGRFLLNEASYLPAFTSAVLSLAFSSQELTKVN